MGRAPLYPLLLGFLLAAPPLAAQTPRVSLGVTLSPETNPEGGGGRKPLI